VVLDIIEPLPDVRAEPAVLEQVLANLLSNAVKFHQPGEAARVRVWAESKKGRVRIWVEDQGIGIAPEHQQKIFEAFERLHGQEAYPGSGIGLAIVRIGAERIGGSVGVISDGRKGAKFWLELLSTDTQPSDHAGKV
jgi:signal transduction histidine kinase